ncbi:MAG: HNH endonuclease [Saprospirales bacterium]|nr:HNH endonuclease [Saprospirales bacterium]
MDDKPAGKIFRPLHHLQSDGLWLLINKEGLQQEEFIGSKTTLEKTIAYGKLEDELFKLLQSPDTRQLIRIDLLEHFFSEKHQVYSAAHPHRFFEFLLEAEAEVLLEPKAQYGHRTIEYHGYFRDTAFKKHVLRLYDHTCCMSGLRVFADVPMVEAAHISQFSHSGNNAITNGLALCPNLHTAFDHGLISLDKHYRVVLKKDLQEYPHSLYPFTSLRTKHPLARKRAVPSVPKVSEEHRERFGLG